MDSAGGTYFESRAAEATSELPHRPPRLGSSPFAKKHSRQVYSCPLVPKCICQRSSRPGDECNGSIITSSGGPQLRVPLFDDRDAGDEGA